MASGHEVGQVLKRDAGHLTDRFVGLPYRSHGTPQSPAESIFGCCRLAGLGPLKEPRKLRADGSIDVGVALWLLQGHSETS